MPELWPLRRWDYTTSGGSDGQGTSGRRGRCEDAVKTSSQSVEEIELQVPSDAECDGPGRGWCGGRLITASNWPPTARRSLRSGTTRAPRGQLALWSREVSDSSAFSGGL